MKFPSFDYASVIFVRKESDFNSFKELILEFAISIEFDLAYQGFLCEMSTLTEQYSSPSGAAFLLNLHGIPVGCIGIRRKTAQVAEIRRFYIRPGIVGLKYKKMLMEVAIDWARQAGLVIVRLNPADSMGAAPKICIDNGFHENNSQRNGIPGGAKMLELWLEKNPEYQILSTV